MTHDTGDLIRITLFDEWPPTVNALRSLAQMPHVAVMEARFPFSAEMSFDAIVSPANSFGFMDGGIDLAYTQFFGAELEQRVKAEIAKRPFGELLVGEAIVVPTGHGRIPHLIAAPTMRVPKPINDWYDVVLATRAAIRAALDHHVMEHRFRAVLPDGRPVGASQVHGHNLMATEAFVVDVPKPLRSVAMPGMGTGSGRVNPSVAAKAIEAGILAALSPPPPPASWHEAYLRYRAMAP